MIKVRVKTLSNLFIGGASRPFEIGGIDQWTAVDQEGFPCIPASSFKGSLRMIVSEDENSEAIEKIGKQYAEYLQKEKAEHWEQIQTMEEAAIQRIETHYENAVKSASPCYLFGIKGFNNTPKLLFNDLKLCKEYRNYQTCFSIDTKTFIQEEGGEPKSNPRTYKTAVAGIEFEGEIELYRFENKYMDDNMMEMCKEYVINNLLKFNEGIYRLGNSKSRGYGKVQVSIVEEEE